MPSTINNFRDINNFKGIDITVKGIIKQTKGKSQLIVNNKEQSQSS